MHRPIGWVDWIPNLLHRMDGRPEDRPSNIFLAIRAGSPARQSWQPCRQPQAIKRKKPKAASTTLLGPWWGQQQAVECRADRRRWSRSGPGSAKAIQSTQRNGRRWPIARQSRPPGKPFRCPAEITLQAPISLFQRARGGVRLVRHPASLCRSNDGNTTDDMREINGSNFEEDVLGDQFFQSQVRQQPIEQVFVQIKFFRNPREPFIARHASCASAPHCRSSNPVGTP